MSPTSSSRPRHAAIIVLAAIASLFAMFLHPPQARAESVLDPLPPIPLNAVVAAGSATGLGPDGEPRLYYVSSGNEAVLSIVNALTGESIEEFPLPQASGAWAVISLPNGDVYIGSYSTGRLFHYSVADNTVEDLGVMVEGETIIWHLTQDENGVVYGGTGQFGGHVFSYDPATGEKHDYGAFGTTEVPVLAHAIAAGEGTIYMGTAPVPELYAIDIATGDRTEIPIPDVGGQQGVYDLDLRDGLLFMRVTSNGNPQPLHVYDTATGEWIEEIPGVHGLRMSTIAPDGTSVYFVKDKELHRYDLTTRTWEPTGLDGVSDVRAFGFLDLDDPEWPGETLVGADYQGNYFLYSPADGSSAIRSADAAGVAANTRAIAEGPDGRIYFSSYLGGDLAVYDPATDAMTRLAETPQTEGMATHDGALYLGTYPRAQILRYDPDLPTEPGTNPSIALDLYSEDQSRPWAMESAGKHLAVGTVPSNGSVGGMLAILDTTTGEHWTEEVAGGHSVVGLTHRDGVLYGTTSVFGGSGAPRPSEKEGVLFAYDIEQREMLWQIEPQAGEGAFGELAFDKSGDLWIASPSMVFKVDIESRTVVGSESYGPYPWDDVEYVWVASRLWVDPYDDHVYVTTQGSTWRINPETLERERVFRPVSYALMASNGFTYLTRDTDAWAWQHAPRPAVQVETSEAERGGRMTVSISGLGPDEPVALWGRPGATLHGELRADASGVATASLPVPDDAPRGTASIEVVRPLTGSIVRADYEVVEPVVEPTPEPTPDPSEDPIEEPTEEPSAPAVDDLYSTPGFHNVNGRWWYTECEPYSQTIRCTTDIWATSTVHEDGAFTSTNGWVFNNLTYLPYMTRAAWGTNPLANTGSWTAADGREWRTECDTAVSGSNGCRTWVRSDVVAASQAADGTWTYSLAKQWVANNLVRFG